MRHLALVAALLLLPGFAFGQTQETESYVAGKLTQLIRCDAAGGSEDEDGQVCADGDWTTAIPVEQGETIRVLFRASAGTAEAKLWGCRASRTTADVATALQTFSPEVNTVLAGGIWCWDLTALAGVTLTGVAEANFAEINTELGVGWAVGEIETCTACDAELVITVSKP